jgi:hypothetical protein
MGKPYITEAINPQDPKILRVHANFLMRSEERHLLESPLL